MKADPADWFGIDQDAGLDGFVLAGGGHSDTPPRRRRCFGGQADGLPQLCGARQFALQVLRQGWQQLVFGHTDRVGFALEGKLHFHIVFLGAEDDADRGIVVWRPLVGIEQIEVEVHLAGVLRLELADFQFDRHQALEEAMVEEQIDEVLLRSSHHPILAADEAEAIAELQDEIPQLRDQAIFQFALAAWPRPRNSRF